MDIPWYDTTRLAFAGFAQMLFSRNIYEGMAGAKLMAQAYLTEAAIGPVAGTVIEGVGTVVRSAGGKIVVERVMSRAELEATEKSGLLRGGRDGTHYVTDSVGTDSSLGAKSRLALPTEPEVKVTMELDRSAVSGSSKVQPAFGEVGGGTERTASGNVSVKILSVKEMR